MTTLNGALPELIEREGRLRALAAAEGLLYVVAPYGGVRTQTDTLAIQRYRDDDYRVYVAAAKKAGKTPVSIQEFRPMQPFGNSYHNYGGAFDISFDPILGARRPASMSIDAAMSRVGALGAKVGLVWGGLWAKPNTDRPHFQLPGGLPDIRTRYLAMTQPQPAAAPTIAHLPDVPAMIAAALPGAQAAANKAAPSFDFRLPSVHLPPLTRTTAVTAGALVAAGLLVVALFRRWRDDQ